MKDKLRELVIALTKECGESDKDSRIRVATVRLFLKKMLAILDAEGDGGAVGCLTISRFRGSDAMVNHDFDYYGNLPDGSYSLYPNPARSGVVRDEDVEGAKDAFFENGDYDLGDGGWIGDKAIRATLEHFAKGERHER